MTLLKHGINSSGLTLSFSKCCGPAKQMLAPLSEKICNVTDGFEYLLHDVYGVSCAAISVILLSEAVVNCCFCLANLTWASKAPTDSSVFFLHT